MKTLYLTDLDGTFLNNKAAVSKRSKQIINLLSKNGVLFTIASARTYATVIPMFEGVTLPCPLVLMNGVCIFDSQKKQTISRKTISDITTKRVVDAFAKYQKNPMVYFEHDNSMLVEYRELLTKSQKDYVAHRENFYKKRFVQTDFYSIDGNHDIVYIASLDKKEELEPIYQIVSGFDDVSCNFYPDNYCGEYFLEVYKKDVSKASGAIFVKELLGADKIVAFGDNINDIPLFELADEAYAVSNSCDELKKLATGVIGSNDEDAVAEFLLERFNKGLINS